MLWFSIMAHSGFCLNRHEVGPVQSTPPQRSRHLNRLGPEGHNNSFLPSWGEMRIDSLSLAFFSTAHNVAVHTPVHLCAPVGLSLWVTGLHVLCWKGVHLKCFRRCQVSLQNICTTSRPRLPPTPYAVASVSTCSRDDQWRKILPAVLSEASRTQATVHMFFSNDTAASQRGGVLGNSPRTPFLPPRLTFQILRGGPQFPSSDAPASASAWRPLCAQGLSNCTFHPLFSATESGALRIFPPKFPNGRVNVYLGEGKDQSHGDPSVVKGSAYRVSNHF